jgi:hypothetical protein
MLVTPRFQRDVLKANIASRDATMIEGFIINLSNR